MAAIFDTFDEGFTRTSIIAASGDATLMGWFYIGTLTPVDFTTFFYLGNDPVTLYTQYVWVGLQGTGPNVGKVQLSISANPSLFSPAALSLGWHHIAYVREGTAHRVYVDGTLVISTTLNVSSETHTVGYIGTDTYTEDWEASRAAYWREWPSALTLTEIDAEIISTTPVKASPYHVASFAANNQDSSGNGRHWTDIGTVSYGAQPQWIYARPNEAITVAENVATRYADAVRLTVNDDLTVTDVFADSYLRDPDDRKYGIQTHVTRISGTSSTSAARYISPIGAGSWFSSQAAASPRMPVGGIWRNLKIVLGTSPGGGRSRNYRLYVNNVASTLQVTISDTNLEGQDTTHSIPVGPEDEVVLVMTPTGTPSADSGGTHIAIEFEGVTPGVSVHMANGSAGSPSASVTNYLGIFQLGGTWNSNNNNVRSVIAVEGDVVGYAIDSSIAPAGSNPWTFYLYKNGTRQDGTGGTPNTQLVISSTNRNDAWAGELSASPGDFVSVQCVPSGGSTFPNFPIAVGFRADVDGESHVGSHPNSVSNTVDDYYPPIGGATSTTDTVEAIGNLTTFTLQELRVATNNTPGGAASRTFTTRKNNADESLAVAISGGGSSGVDTVGPVTITRNDRWGLKHTPASSPTTGTFPAVAWKQYIVPGTQPLSINVADAISVSDAPEIRPGLILLNVHETVTVAEHVVATNNTHGEGIDVIAVADEATVVLTTILLHPTVWDAITVTESRTAALTALRLSVNKADTITVRESVLKQPKIPYKTLRADFIRVRDVVTAQTRIGGGLWVRVHDAITVAENPMYLGYGAHPTTPGAHDPGTINAGPNPGVPPPPGSPPAGFGTDYWVDGV